jgi:hypothetical protein
MRKLNTKPTEPERQANGCTYEFWRNPTKKSRNPLTLAHNQMESHGGTVKEKQNWEILSFQEKNGLEAHHLRWHRCRGR